ncbi:hypothetical protein PMIN06_008582 [Paraphaeosphaeria minitans]
MLPAPPSGSRRTEHVHNSLHTSSGRRACARLLGSRWPSITLPTMSRGQVDLSSLTGLTVSFCYPRTAAPNETITAEWNAIPGAQGCTPQACSIRDEIDRFRQLRVEPLYGLSTQDTQYQHEARERLHLQHDLLSDEPLEFAMALKPPTFEWQGESIVKRLVLAVEEGKIVDVWYPVFRPYKSVKMSRSG